MSFAWLKLRPGEITNTVVVVCKFTTIFAIKYFGQYTCWAQSRRVTLLALLSASYYVSCTIDLGSVMTYVFKHSKRYLQMIQCVAKYNYIMVYLMSQPTAISKTLSSERTKKFPSIVRFSYNVAIARIEPSYVGISAMSQNTTAMDIVMPWNPVYI